MSRAARAFEDFTGRKPKRVLRTKLPDRDVSGWEMGPLVGVAYEATRDGRTKQYFHEFKKSARPTLVSQDDGAQLYIAGGRYKVTDRGVEDMPRMFVVNPSPRSGRKRKASPMRRRRATSRRRRRTSNVAIFRANPIRRRRRHRVRARRRRSYARNPVAIRRTHRRRRHSVARRRYRRNPSARAMGGGIVKLALPAMGIGAGAIGSEILMSYLPIPAAWKTGNVRHLTKGAVGVAAGLVLGKVLRMKRLGNFFALGAIAIATHDFLKDMLAANVPGVHLSRYVPPIHGVVGSLRGMGFTSPGRVGRLNAYVPPIHGTVGALDGIKYTRTGGETGYQA